MVQFIKIVDRYQTHFINIEDIKCITTDNEEVQPIWHIHTSTTDFSGIQVTNKQTIEKLQQLIDDNMF